MNAKVPAYQPREVTTVLADLRGGLVTLLSSIYIIMLIPSMLGNGPDGMPLSSIAGTALACARRTKF